MGTLRQMKQQIAHRLSLAVEVARLVGEELVARMTEVPQTQLRETAMWLRIAVVMQGILLLLDLTALMRPQILLAVQLGIPSRIVLLTLVVGLTAVTLVEAATLLIVKKALRDPGPS